MKNLMAPNIPLALVLLAAPAAGSACRHRHGPGPSAVGPRFGWVEAGRLSGGARPSYCSLH